MAPGLPASASLDGLVCSDNSALYKALLQKDCVLPSLSPSTKPSLSFWSYFGDILTPTKCCHFMCFKKALP